MAIQYQATVVALPITALMTSQFEDYLKEAHIQGKVKFLYMAAEDLGGIIPKNGDLLEFDGFKWEAKKITPLNPAGTAIMYSVLCMQGGQLP